MTPVRWTGTTALRWGWRFAREPLVTTRRIFETAGPFVILAEGLPVIRPTRAVMLGVPLVLTAGHRFIRNYCQSPQFGEEPAFCPGDPEVRPHGG